MVVVSRRKQLIAVVLILFVFLGSGFWLHKRFFAEISFNSKDWKERPSTRWRQLRDIQAQFASGQWDAGRLYDELGSDRPGETRSDFVRRVIDRAGISYSVNQVPSLKGHNQNLVIFVNPKSGSVGEWEVTGD